MLIYAPGWSLASQFWSYTPPKKKVSFPAAKKWKFPTENCFPDPFFFLIFLAFYCLCGENFVTPFSTLAMIQGSLPTNSTTPDRLRSWTKTESEDFPGFGVRTLSKKFFQKVHDWILIYTPKEAHSRIFVTGGSVIAWQMWAKKKLFSGRPACSFEIVLFVPTSTSLIITQRHRMYRKK